jgi:hypothetical protein
VTDVLTPLPGFAGSGGSINGAQAPASPRARRARRARWRDTRLIAGILLILLAVVAGARVIGAATKTVRWVSVSHALPAGHVLTAADLAAVGAHLPASAAKHYFTADPAQLVGRVLTRPLTAGELLPAAALATGSGPASRVLPVLVKAGRLPALTAGDRVDVYVLATTGGPARGATAAQEVRVLHDVEFVGADVLGSGATSVQLRVAPQDAISAVAASQSERVDIVRIDRDAAGQPGEPGASTAPAYGS